MSGRLVAAVLLGFGAGWLCGALNRVRRYAPTMIYQVLRLDRQDEQLAQYERDLADLAQRLARAESSTDRGGAVDHVTCEAAVAMLSQIVRTQAAYIKALEGGADLGEQAGEYLREHGGGQ